MCKRVFPFLTICLLCTCPHRALAPAKDASKSGREGKCTSYLKNLLYRILHVAVTNRWRSSSAIYTPQLRTHPTFSLLLHCNPIFFTTKALVIPHIISRRKQQDSRTSRLYLSNLIETQASKISHSYPCQKWLSRPRKEASDSLIPRFHHAFIRFPNKSARTLRAIRYFTLLRCKNTQRRRWSEGPHPSECE